jgi:hypothetical protein
LNGKVAPRPPSTFYTQKLEFRGTRPGLAALQQLDFGPRDLVLDAALQTP